MAIYDLGPAVNFGALGESGGVYLDDADGYTMPVTAGVPTIINQANSTAGATPLKEGPEGGSVQVNGVAGSLTLNVAGIYEASLSSSFSADGGANVEGAIYLNNVRRGEVAFERDILNQNRVGSVGPSDTIEILDSDLPAVLDARVTLDTTRVLNIRHFSLHVMGGSR
jgi:hypothetical protein